MHYAGTKLEHAKSTDELVAELLLLRDALTHLSLATIDLLFEARRICPGEEPADALAILKKIAEPH